MDILNFPLFAVAVLALHAVPGPDSLYVMGRSLAQGTAAGVMAMLGIMAGCAVHTLVSAFGFAALLAALPGFFPVIRLLGAAYLIYQGLRLILASRPGKRAAASTDHPSRRSVLLETFLTNLLNPKVVLFFLAFFPQFVDPQGTHKVASCLVLGGFFAVTAGIWAMAIALMAGKLAQRVDHQGRLGVLFGRLVGVLFAVLGIRLIV